MSPIRQVATATPRRLTVEQEPFLVARSLSTTYSHGFIVSPHTHAAHQLLFASTGAMTVTASHMSWMIPPGHAVLIPAGTRHDIRMWGDVAMRSLYFPTGAPMPAFDAGGCRVIAIRPLVRELILRIAELAALDSRVDAEARLHGVLMDELQSVPTEPLMLPLPTDPRGLQAAEWMLQNPSETATIETMAQTTGASARTLERVFRDETGIPIGIWRQKAKLLESVRVLAQGRSVTDAALESGYSSVSAFISAFKQTFGYTPGVLLDGSSRD